MISRAVKAEFASFDDLLKNSEVPVLVDFYAVWCALGTSRRPPLCLVPTALTPTNCVPHALAPLLSRRCGPCQMISPVLADIQNTLKCAIRPGPLPDCARAAKAGFPECYTARLTGADAPLRLK